MSHCLFVDVGWFVHFPGIDHVCYASMCFSSLSIHWLVRMAFWVNQYNSLMFYMIVLFFNCFCSFIWFLFCSVVFGYGIYRNQRQAPMPLTLQDVKNTSDPRWFLVCKSTFEIVYTLPEYVLEIHVKWWFWCYVRVCVCVFCCLCADLCMYQVFAKTKQGFCRHELSFERGNAIRSRTDMGWDIVPWGFERLLSWIHKEYSPKGGILASW